VTDDDDDDVGHWDSLIGIVDERSGNRIPITRLSAPVQTSLRPKQIPVP
jgi:hypothetical protein